MDNQYIEYKNTKYEIVNFKQFKFFKNEWTNMEERKEYFGEYLLYSFHKFAGIPYSGGGGARWEYYAIKREELKGESKK